MAELLVEGPLDRGMLSLRADLVDPAVAAALDALWGLPVPDVRRIEVREGASAAWMSPDELLILLPGIAAGPEAEAALAARLEGTHALVLDVSAARVLFRLEGRGAREALAKGAPVDLRPAAFGPGAFRRTRLGQIAAAFWAEEGERFGLVCHRSVAGHAAEWLARAAAPQSLPGVM